MNQALQAIVTEWIDIPMGSGRPMEAYLACPETQPGQDKTWPAVIVLMEIFGVNSWIRDITEHLAREGYVAIAPNYYHRTTSNLELGYTEQDMNIGRRHKEKTTREGVLTDIRAVITMLQERSDVGASERMGCVGFCFGGHVAYIAAGFDEIAATAAFYPGGVATMSPGGGSPTVSHSREIEGEILVLFGEQDPLIPEEDTCIIEQALRDAGVRHEVVRYADTGHGFFCDQRADYNPAASEDAWRRVKELFASSLR